MAQLPNNDGRPQQALFTSIMAIRRLFVSYRSRNETQKGNKHDNVSTKNICCN